MSILSQLDSLAEADLDNQRVFVRADLDVPISSSGEVLDDGPLQRAAITIRQLREAGARVVVGSRFGELKGGPGSGRKGEAAPSIEPAAARLSEILEMEVILPDSCSGDAVKRVITNMRDSQICVLENLCMEEDMGAGEEAFARRLMPFADMFIGDSLRALSTKSATTTILPRLMDTRLVSQQLLSELNALARVKNHLEPPHLVVFGAAPLSDNLSLLQSVTGDRGKVMLVGVPANTMLAAKGARRGKSRIEEDYLAGARTLAEQLGDRLLLPIDLVVGENPRSSSSEVVTADDVPADRMALDLGPRSLELLESEVVQAGTICWIGPVGAHQSGLYAGGTRKVTELLSRAPGFTVVAGDDSVAAARATAPEAVAHIDCLADGGGAALSLLTGNKLPGLEALRGSGTS